MLDMAAIVASPDEPGAKSRQAAEARARLADAARIAAGELKGTKPPRVATAAHAALTEFLTALSVENEAAARFFRDSTTGAKAQLASAQALTQTVGRRYEELRERLRETQGLALPVLNFPGAAAGPDAGRTLDYQIALNTALLSAPELAVPLARLRDSLSRLTGSQSEQEIRSLYQSAAEELRYSLLRLDALQALLARTAPPPQFGTAHELLSAGLDCLRRGLVEFERSFASVAAGGSVAGFDEANRAMECHRVAWTGLWQELRSTTGG